MSEPFPPTEDETAGSAGHDELAHATAPQPDEPDGADDLPGHPVAEEGPGV